MRGVDCAPIRDAMLPQLGIALDCEFLQSVLTDRTGWKIARCGVRHARYKPGRNCLICYEAALEDGGWRFFAARLYEPGQSLSRFLKAHRGDLAPVRSGDPVMHIGELGMVLWSFPNDRKLSGLRFFDDWAWLRNEASRLSGQPVSQMDPQLVHYVPEHGCTVRVGELFAKTYPDDTGAATYRNMRRLWADGRMPMAEPVHYDEGRRILWQRALTGTTLAAGGPIAPSALADAGQTLAVLHTSSVEAARQSTPEEALARLQQAEAILQAAGFEASRAADELAASIPWLEERATLHGDLHLKNIFRGPHGTALIDLDDLRRGSPEQDLGSFIASLHTAALMHGQPAAAVEAMASAMLRSYCAASASKLDREALAWHTAAALISEQCARCVTRLKRGRLAILPQLLALATAVRQGRLA